MLTQVEVDPDDPAFKNQPKPIGYFYTEQETRVLHEELGWEMREDCWPRLRNIVPSPYPKHVADICLVQGRRKQRRRGHCRRRRQHLRMSRNWGRAFDAQIEATLAPFRDAAERLTSVPGISNVAAQVILAEIVPDMSSFPTAGHLLSWAGLTPRRSTRVKKGAP